MNRFSRDLLLAALLVLSFAASARAQERFIVLGSTTSTENSGLFSHILPVFTRDTGIAVRVVAVGTGQAIRLGRNGDVDALLVHHTPSEEELVREGVASGRWNVMFNDFVIVGPDRDPAGIGGMREATAALARLAAAKAPFVSRGDDSGTHKLELELWTAASINPRADSGRWYREIGAGMGAALNTAAAMDAYLLTDRGTWLSFKNRGTLHVLVEGDERLRNQYGVLPIDPARHPHVKAALARRFVDWLIGPEGQAAISSLTVNGEPLFFPNATAKPGT